ncbi:hypothetical protein A6V39_00265 [Candidatus Mycoplasma haematobovis]|uniref:Uncharacterized protein n=1 Tax=Candidatus Mycoplasma haematobovis TaxID=432608 RepID=A0A1A9QDE4_9MOLU|nr:hypothetical protein [Candidatus Mycoplasma haematobovis]OAL10483.1 hypothetical protein A6V39_00265 [Candidatus Mycoplasma haematobovis]
MALSTKNIALIGGGASAIAGGSAGTYYLLQDKTIEHRLASEGITLINGKDEYEAAFMERRNNEAFRTTIGNVNADTTSENGWGILKKWCEDNLKLDLSEKNVKNTLPKVKEYCAKPSLDIETRYIKLGKKLITENGWKEKYRTLKSGNNNIDQEIGIVSSAIADDSDNTKAGKALQKWCNQKIKTPLVQDKTDEIWKKVETRCLQP